VDDLKKVLLVLILTMVFMSMLPSIAMAADTTEATVKIDLTTLFVALLNIIVMVVARYAVPWIKSKTTESQRQKMLSAVNVAVYAAEQMLGAGFGQDKLDQVKKWLQEQGFDIDSTAVLTAIEAAVQQLTLQQAKLPNLLT
jgi:predicted Kef-type K+ transport protein